MIKSIVAIFSAVLLLSACQTAGPNQTGGTLIGAAAGGLAGAQFGSGSGRLATTAIGTLFGAIVGNNVGRSMDDQNRHQVDQNIHSSLNTGRPTAWNDPHSGYRGDFRPSHRHFQGQHGQRCRSYTSTIYVHGHPQVNRGVACQRRDGSWQVQ